MLCDRFENERKQFMVAKRFLYAVYWLCFVRVFLCNFIVFDLLDLFVSMRQYILVSVIGV